VKITTEAGKPIYFIDGRRVDKDEMRAAMTRRFDETKHTTWPWNTTIASRMER